MYMYFHHESYQGCSDQYGWYGHGHTTLNRAVGSGVVSEVMAIPLFMLDATFLPKDSALAVAVNFEHELNGYDTSMAMLRSNLEQVLMWLYIEDHELKPRPLHTT